MIAVAATSIWNSLYRLVDELSVNQTVALGGGGTGASFATSAYGAESLQSSLQIFTYGVGAIGALLSVGLLLLKFIQQRREMGAWRVRNRAELDGIHAKQNDSAIDRADLRSRQNSSDFRQDSSDSRQDSSDIDRADLHRRLDTLDNE